MAEWIETTLGKFVALQRGHDLPSSARVPGGVPVIGSGGPTGWHNKAKVKGPGITIGRAANLGVPTLVHSDFWPLNTTLYVTDFRGNDVRFVYNLFKVIDLTGFNSGSVQPMLNRNYIQKFPLVVPVPRGQRAIAAVLGALDDKIAVNERIRETSVVLAISRFEEAVDGGISTPSTTLGELAAARHLEISDGYRTKKAEYGHPGIPILRASDVSDFRITSSFVDFVSDNFHRQMRNKISHPGDVILTTKGTVGRTAMMPPRGQEFVYSPQICFFRVAEYSRISAELLFLWMHSQEFWRQATSLKGQTDMADYLSLRDIRSMKITLPNPELHRRIHAGASLLLMQAETRQQESDTLMALRDTLLPELMSGKLRVRDAERIVEDTV